MLDSVLHQARTTAVTTTQTLADNTRLHLNQLVRDSESDAKQYVVTDLDGDYIELVRVFPPIENEPMQFGDQKRLTEQTFINDFDQQSESVSDPLSGQTQRVPVWAY